MQPELTGIHHVTAIAGDPQANVNFYTKVLGLSLVKKTVNFDDPNTYHFYYGDSTGTPGSILTFFPWQGARRGRQGPGQIGATAFAAPEGSLGAWSDHLKRHGVTIAAKALRFGQEMLAFHDPDSLPVEIIGSEPGGERRIAKIHSATLHQSRPDATEALLAGTMGFRRTAQEGNRIRFETGSGGSVDIWIDLGAQRALGGAGTVHHIAFRTPNDASQLAWRESLSKLGYHVSPVMDRQYFHSIYYREPGGTLFEIATDPPGFLVDEDAASLGRSLKLPPMYEGMRDAIERSLPAIQAG